MGDDAIALPTSYELLAFEVAMLRETALEQVAEGCWSCCWKREAIEGPVGFVFHYDDEARAIAPMAFCETCRGSIKLSRIAQILADLRPIDFVRADAIDAWGDVLMGFPGASLEEKTEAVAAAFGLNTGVDS